jgi:hypothetical protein
MYACHHSDPSWWGETYAVNRDNLVGSVTTYKLNQKQRQKRHKHRATAVCCSRSIVELLNDLVNNFRVSGLSTPFSPNDTSSNQESKSAYDGDHQTSAVGGPEK